MVNPWPQEPSVSSKFPWKLFFPNVCLYRERWPLRGNVCISCLRSQCMLLMLTLERLGTVLPGIIGKAHAATCQPCSLGGKGTGNTPITCPEPASQSCLAECARAARVARVRESERGLYMRHLTTSAVHVTMHSAVIRGCGGSNLCRSEWAFATPGAVPVALALIANPWRGGVCKTRTPRDVVNRNAGIKRLLIRTAVDL